LKKITFGILIGIVVFIAICFIFYIPQGFKTKLDSNHPHIKYNDEFFGKVEKVFNNRGSIYFDLENNQNFCIFKTRNYDYSPFGIDDFVLPGDSISKQKHTDTIFVFKDKKKYFFIVEKDINE
jgi:hypothetical protein